MDLISRKDAIEAIKDPVVKVFAMYALKSVPAAPAVPLDKLCEWLERNAAGRWNGLEYTAAGWKDELTRWMEKQNAKEKN